MKTNLIATLLTIALAIHHLQAQSFDVISVKQSPPDTPGHFAMENGRITAEGLSLSSYLMEAWDLILSRNQLDTMRARLPKWAITDTFEIHATAQGNPTRNQMNLMLQALLAERFALKTHFETTTATVLALTLDKPNKLGPKLRPHNEGPPCNISVTTFPPTCDQLSATDKPNHIVLVGARNVTIPQLAAFLSSLGRLDRPTIDQTTLTGAFDFTLEFTKDPQPDAQGLTLQEAMQEQLGLKLKPTTAPITTLVIDHVEPPTPN